jgi:signal recognition particle subunit SRP54
MKKMMSQMHDPKFMARMQRMAGGMKGMGGMPGLGGGGGFKLPF